VSRSMTFYSLDSNANTNRPFDIFDPFDILDEKTLLQVNASMVVGVLFILTLTAFVSGASGSYIISEVTGRNLLGLATFLLVFPFTISTAAILFKEPSRFTRMQSFEFAKRNTALGFILFAGYIFLIVLLPVFTGARPSHRRGKA
jgi:hypothetical protein